MCSTFNMRWQWMFGTYRFHFLKNHLKLKNTRTFKLTLIVLQTSNIVDSDKNLLKVLRSLKYTSNNLFDLRVVCYLFLGEANVICKKPLTEKSPVIAWKNMKHIIKRRYHKGSNTIIVSLFQRAIDHAVNICLVSTDKLKLEYCGILISALLDEEEKLTVVPFKETIKNTFKEIETINFHGGEFIQMMSQRYR